jgi:hypothetical protein
LDYRIGATFLRGSGVRDVFVHEENARFKTIEEWFLDKGGIGIVLYFGNDCHVRIGADIETIEEQRFRGCQTIESVTFESGSELKAIGANAFRECGSFERVQFDGLCLQLEYRCFGDCRELKLGLVPFLLIVSLRPFERGGIAEQESLSGKTEPDEQAGFHVSRKVIRSDFQ